MNQLECFVASTEASRSDVMRYLQLLRILDERVSFHMASARHIAALRVEQLSIQASPPTRSGRGDRAADRRGNSTASLGTRPSAEVTSSSQVLEEQFAWHETCALRYTKERENLAAELEERCKEVKAALALRLQQFSLVADTPVPERY